MANISENLLVKEARGNVAKQFVYRRHGNDTHITKMPKFDKDRQPTQGQEKVRGLFSLAALYAQGAVSSAELKAQYKRKAAPGKTAFNVAFKDYLKSPVVNMISTENYTGLIGSTITVTAMDDFRVVKVTVSIYTADNELVEQGNAILNPVNRSQWIYTATEDHIALEGSTIKAIASDLPGNQGSLEVLL